jgi:hypothetical protein
MVGKPLPELRQLYKEYLDDPKPFIQGLTGDSGLESPEEDLLVEEDDYDTEQNGQGGDAIGRGVNGEEESEDDMGDIKGVFFEDEEGHVVDLTADEE